MAKEETHSSIQEGLAYKQQASTVEVELDGLKEQERLLTSQVGGSTQYSIYCDVSVTT